MKKESLNSAHTAKNVPTKIKKHTVHCKIIPYFISRRTRSISPSHSNLE